MKRYEFDAVLQETPDNGGAYVVFPWDIRREFGKGRIKVHAAFDGIPYDGSIVNMGLKNADGSVCYIIGVLKAIREKLHKRAGDPLHVVIEPIPVQENETRESDPDTLLFFDGHPEALALYQVFERLLYRTFPAVNKRVQKTQITFSNRHVFACVSFARVKRKAELPEGYMVITLGLPGPLDSARVAVKTEPYPGRWTHHIVVSQPEELDGELLSWIREAYDFADAKRKLPRGCQRSASSEISD